MSQSRRRSAHYIMRTRRRFARVGAGLSANCREPAEKQVRTVHPAKSRWPVSGPLRNPSRTSPPRPAGRSPLCGSGPSDASLVRELPGTGRKTGTHGASGKIKVACFRAASQPFRGQVPRPAGRSPLCGSGPSDASLVRDISGFVGADLSANCREPAAKPAASVHQIQPR